MISSQRPWPLDHVAGRSGGLYPQLYCKRYIQMIGNIHAPVTVTLGKEIGLEAGRVTELLKAVEKSNSSALTVTSNPEFLSPES